MKMDTFIIICTALISGLLAAVFSFIVQKKSEIRNQKMDVFKTLMASRYLIWSEASVKALNSIEVVFYRHKNVRAAFARFLDEAEKQQSNNQSVNDKYLKLLEEISIALKLKTIHWDEIKRSYYPNGLANKINDEEILRKAQIQSVVNKNGKDGMNSQNPISPQQASQLFDTIISQPELLKTLITEGMKRK